MTAKRDSAAQAYVLYSRGRTAHEIGLERAAFTAGWNARKQAEFEAAFNVKRPLHSSAYEPLTPFKPKGGPNAN
jgi:hypothetical protein